MLNQNTPDWQSIRNAVEMGADSIYLNTGTSGLVPRVVHRLAMEYRTQMHHNPTDYVWRSMSDVLWNSRCRLAQHVGSRPDRLIFFSNISQAINTFCLSVKLPAGSEILMSDHDYGSMRWAWERVAGRFGWTIREVALPLSPDSTKELVSTVLGTVTSQTRLIYLSHVLYTTGMVMPIEAICQGARERGLMTFVDGAHAPGMLPLNLTSLDADFYAANLHKWFMTPVGGAFLHVRPGREEHLEPWQVSWAFHDDRSRGDERNEFGSTYWIRPFEMEGTRDVTPWFLVSECSDFLEHIGYDSIRVRHRELSDRVRAELRDIRELELVTPDEFEMRGGLTAFRCSKSIDAQQLRLRLWNEYRIETNAIDWRETQFFRVSTHVYNTEQEVQDLARAVRAILVRPIARGNGV
jgi:isopenicillin-N epimerase